MSGAEVVTRKCGGQSGEATTLAIVRAAIYALRAAIYALREFWRMIRRPKHPLMKESTVSSFGG
jgi:hypothetical protein